MVDWVYRIWNEPIVQLPEGVPPFTHIKQNEISGRRQIKQKEEDIAVCECKYDVTDPESACGERCLNVLTSTECMPGYCPCGDLCKNQRFQKSEYTKTKLFKTEGRGWGLLADENIKSGQFIIEYCGEVISAEEAKQRSQTYEAEGLKDAYIISLNASYFIDATRKGSLARFINHSCQPNCETRKWTVLGETRVGIFASQDIPVGTELSYDYNFEWYGGANVRCLCGAPNCSIFLGAKSHGFQEHNHVWEDGDDRYEVDEFPLYDSAEDEPMSKLSKIMDSFQEAPDIKNGYSDGFGPTYHLESASLHAATCLSDPMDGEPENKIKAEVQEENHDPEESFSVTDPITSSGTGNYNMSGDHNIGLGFGSDPITSSGTGNYNMGVGFGSSKKSAPCIPNRRPKHSGSKHVNGKRIAHLFPSRKVREEIINCEEVRTEATSKLEALYDEIRPAIEERERDSLDSLPTSVAEKWIEASCSKMKADMELYFSIVKNVVCPVPGDIGESNSSENAPNKSEK